MGTNYYLLKKIKYINEKETPATLGCGHHDEDAVKWLTNGFVYCNTYFESIDALNEVFSQTIHIGKSSMGWHFGLCIYPKYGINNLEDWKKLFNDSNNIIVDEYNQEIAVEEMLKNITERKQLDFDQYASEEEFEQAQVKRQNEFAKTVAGIWKHSMDGELYTSYEQLLAENHAQRGIKGLWKRQEDLFTYNTDGTYDYIISGNNTNEGHIFS